MLEQQLKLGLTSSIKPHLLHQTNIDVHQTDVSDFYETDSDQDDPDPFPSCDVDGGDILKFSPTSNFSSFTHSMTTKDHETDDTGLHNDDICGNVSRNVIEANVTEDDDLKFCTATKQQILGDKAFGCEIIHNCEIESNQLTDFDSKSIDSSHNSQSCNKLIDATGKNSELIDLSHNGQSCNKSIDATAQSTHHSAIPDSTNHHRIKIPNSGTTTTCDRNENSNPAYITTIRDENENFDPTYTTTCDRDENSNPAYTTTTCDGNEILLTVPACANCDNDGDTIGNYADPDKTSDDVNTFDDDMVCGTSDDVDTDKTSDDVDIFDDNTMCGTSDDVDTFDDNTVYDGIPPTLFSSSDVDIDDEEDEVLYGKAIQSTDDDIDLIIADLNRFCLFVELRISSGLLYQDLSLA